MPLDMEGGLGPGHSAGDPAPPPPTERGTTAPTFRPMEKRSHISATAELFHKVLLYVDDPTTCQACGIPLTVKHILVECTNLRDIREKYFTVSSTTELFKSTDNHTRPNL